MSTRLRFVNLSWAIPVPDVFVFQVDRCSDRPPLVWTRIRSCAYGWRHELLYTPQLSLIVRNGDSVCWTPERPAPPGSTFQVHCTRGEGAHIEQVEATLHRERDAVLVHNLGSIGWIDAVVLRNGRPLAWEQLAPGQETSFAFDSVLILGADNRVEPGQPIQRSSAERFYTKINLRSITSADLLMTGGGHGPDAMPLSFQLDTIRRS